MGYLYFVISVSNHYKYITANPSTTDQAGYDCKRAKEKGNTHNVTFKPSSNRNKFFLSTVFCIYSQTMN